MSATVWWWWATRDEQLWGFAKNIWSLSAISPLQAMPMPDLDTHLHTCSKFHKQLCHSAIVCQIVCKAFQASLPFSDTMTPMACTAQNQLCGRKAGRTGNSIVRIVSINCRNSWARMLTTSFHIVVNYTASSPTLLSLTSVTVLARNAAKQQRGIFWPCSYINMIQTILNERSIQTLSSNCLDIWEPWNFTKWNQTELCTNRKMTNQLDCSERHYFITCSDYKVCPSWYMLDRSPVQVRATEESQADMNMCENMLIHKLPTSHRKAPVRRQVWTQNLIVVRWKS